MVPQIRDSNDNRFIPSKELFKHFIRIFHLTSLYFPQGPGKLRKVCYWIYFLGFTCLNWSNVVRHCFVVYRSQDTASLLVALGMLAYSIGYAYPATCLSYSITVHLPTLLSQLDEYRKRHGEFINIKGLRRIHTICALGYVFGVSVVALVSSSFFLISAIWINIRDLFYPFTTDSLTNSILTFIYFFMCAHTASSIPYTQLALCVSICYIVHGEIGNLSRNLKEIATDSDERLPIAFQDLPANQTKAIDQDVTCIPTLNLNSTTDRSSYKSDKLDRALEELRLRYESVLDIIAKANDILQHLFFSIIASSIPITCLILYGIITLNSNRPQMLYTVFTNTQIFYLLFVILFIGTYIDHKVKQPLEYVMKINNRNLSAKATSSIQLMSVRYLSLGLGFNVYGLFSLDSSTLLTVIGTLLTYAVVIYQFAQSPASSCQFFNNATNMSPMSL